MNFQGLRILVVDDEEWTRDMVKVALLDVGAVCIEADNGAVAIERARAENFDLVLMDIRMERVDGYLALSVIKSSKPLLPVVLMTGMADAAGMMHGMQLGAEDYLPKPFTIDGLYATIAKTVARPLQTRITGLEMALVRAQELLWKSKSNEIESSPSIFGFAIASILHDVKGELLALANTLAQVESFTNELKQLQQPCTRIRYHLESTQTYLGMINGLVESGVHLTEQCNLLDVLRKTEKMCILRLPKNISLRLTTQGDQYCWDTLGNQDILVGVLRELVRNATAAMRGSGGGIELSLSQLEDYFQIRVADQGPGLPDPIRERLFSGPLGKSTNSGWGLYLASKMMCAMQGRIEVEKSDQKGTIFLITMPKERSAT